MNRKRKGTYYEFKSAAWLAAEGYTVARFAGSFGPFDLMASSRARILLIQVKSGGRWPNSRERKAMRDFPAPRSCTKLIHRWKDFVKEPEVQVVGLQ